MVSKQDKQIIVVERSILFGKNNEQYFQGFRGHNEFDYESRILANLKIMRRGDAEVNPSHQQPIGYTVLVNPKTKQVFLYQRAAKDKDYGEKRLQGKISWGAGGHIEPFDIQKGNPIRESVAREVISEEVEIIGNYSEPKVLGYINDDTNDVGRVHFGILYVIEVDGNAKPKEAEMSRGEFVSVPELERVCASDEFDVETWSRISLEPLKKYLSSNQ